jgi:hypothetical protein
MTDISGALGMPSNKDAVRDEHDFYATDPRAIDDLFSEEKFSEFILEPAAGQGHLVYRMKEYGKIVMGRDLIDRGHGFDVKDFLKSTEQWDGDIITNPPFKYGTEFAYKALGTVKPGNKVAFFVKLLFLETQKRRELFDTHPPKTVYVYSKRIGCFKGGGEDLSGNTAIAYCWVVWEKGYRGPTTLRWI